VYEVVLRPEDGLYPLPYIARQADGSAWEEDGAAPLASADRCRQPFYPDASRIFEEIDRLVLAKQPKPARRRVSFLPCRLEVVTKGAR
jgi:hypothetical protein